MTQIGIGLSKEKKCAPRSHRFGNEGRGVPRLGVGRTVINE